jgi:hypothetical protein
VAVLVLAGDRHVVVAEPHGIAAVAGSAFWPGEAGLLPLGFPEADQGEAGECGRYRIGTAPLQGSDLG